ncbi:MAG: hypothetical protein KDA33_14195 [Phycisphaerales bacterium]|nr:hypothetical protein [Phycisphaerales bacterium]
MSKHRTIFAAFFLVSASSVLAEPTFVAHDPAGGVFNQPGGVTQRNPLVVREADSLDLWSKIGPSFSYDNVAVYYTTNGDAPNGSQGMGFGTTTVLRNTGGFPTIGFQYNEGGDDWWRCDFPIAALNYGHNIRYKIGAWQSGEPSERFAVDGQVFDFDVLLAWPGAGAGAANPSEGFPPVSHYLEEGVVGNNYMNVMLDVNGTVYDVYYPSAGCVQGVSTKNEGYVDGPATFPALLPPGARGQMHMNQGMAGIRLGNVTYWLSNEAGVGYENNAQQYVDDTNVIFTTAKLKNANITIDQYDFCPKDIAFPLDDGASPNRGLYIKRYLITNNEASAQTIDFYYYADFALNGGDSFDGMFTDAARGAMIAYDNTQRLTSSSGEYNPTTFGDYDKNVSVYLGVALRTSDTLGAASGTPATDFWSDSSADQGQGWIGSRLTIPAGAAKEVDVIYVGGFDNFAGATGTYDFQMDNAIDWFLNSDLAAAQTATENYWTNWINGGVTIDFPDDRFDETFRRGLLATALHLDGKNGGIIAGMHNGAYPFVWPRDAAWAAITLARTGHINESKEIFRFLRDIAFRDVEGWGRKGFWKQKYSTDGFTIWGTPQVDETSCYPWGVRYIYDVTGDTTFLEDHYDEVYEAGLASSQDSTNDSRLRYEESVDLVYSMNLWEDSFDVFNYSNASVIRGLEDAARVADILDQNVCPGGPGTCGYHSDKALFESRANAIRAGLDARLAWNGENTDISQIGITYPFEIYPPGHARAELLMDRMNGVANDMFGNNHPLVNFGGEWNDLINRYWGDGYWNNPGAPNANGSPWFLTTMWYGCYYGMRQDINPGKGDIDNHRYRTELLLDRLGPIGFGAEQIAPSNSLLEPSAPDFLLQTAWPNAWESMSFFVDSMMLFLDVTPDAPNNTLRIEPKLPSGWSTMSFANIPVGNVRVSVTCDEADGVNGNTFTNETGGMLDFDTVIRIPAGANLLGATRTDALDCVAAGVDSYDPATGRVRVLGALDAGAASTTRIDVLYGDAGDFVAPAGVDLSDIPEFVAILLGANTDCVALLKADMNADGVVNGADISGFTSALAP